MEMQTAIDRVINGKDLDEPTMTSVMRQIMGGEATPAQIGGFLVAPANEG